MERIQHTNLLYTILIILLSGIVWSCTDDHVYAIPTAEIKGSAVTFSIKVPGAGIPKSSGPTTYSLSAADENAVNEIAVLLFDSNGNYTNQPSYVNSSKIITNPEDSRIKTFTIEVPEGTYNMVVLANSNQSLNSVLSTISVGEPKTEVLNKLLLTNSGKWNASPGSANYLHIPMWGEVAVTVSASMPIKTPVALVRMVAKIDVALTTATAKSKFNLQNVRLYNFNDKGHIVPKAANWNSETPIATAPTVPSDATKITTPLIYDYSDGSITSDPDAATNGIACINEIYTFEAAAGNASNLTNNTCLVVGGYFSGDNTLTYYRIDFTNTSEATTYLPLLRNHRYEIKITDVKERGLPSALEAFNANSTNIEANMKIWDDAQITHIMFDEQYILGVSQDEFIFSSDARAANSSDNELAITTDAPNGWIVEKVVDAYGNATTWLSVNLPAGDANATTATKLMMTNNNSYNRKGFIHLKAGKLTYIIPVEQNGIPQPEANSYIVAPNGAALKIPVVRANQSMIRNQLVAGNAFTAELVWTDNSSSIKSISVEGTGPTGFLVVEPGTAEGNAVVAIKFGGKILWSWHIWVTAYAPTSTVPTNTFMDRNLGAIGNTPGAVNTKGMLYQWGRKDPFTRGNTNIIITEVSSSAGPSSGLSLSVENPTTFYYSTKNLKDWYTHTGSENHQNDNLWNSTTNTKTVYDPCPPGWRVPLIGVWSGLTTSDFQWNVTNKGRTNNSFGGFYPAAGSRSYANGGLVYDGSQGYYWSASVKGSDASCLSFNDGNVDTSDSPQSVAGRANGHSVRCVKE